MLLGKEQILTQFARRTRIEPSQIFGGDLHLQELTRAAFRTIARDAAVGENSVDIERWNGGIFAAIVVSPETKQPLLTLDELLGMPHRDDLWEEIKRIATIGLNFSEVGAAPLEPPSSD